MKTVNIQGVGDFQLRRNYWAGVHPENPDVTITIDTYDFSPTFDFTPEQMARVQKVCAAWDAVLARSLSYITERRKDYKLKATKFKNPHIYISAEDWAVCFATNRASEAMVNVDFRDEDPFQLTIGD